MGFHGVGFFRRWWWCLLLWEMGLIGGVVLLMADLDQGWWVWFRIFRLWSWIYESCMDECERVFGYGFMGLFLGFMGLIYRGFNVECVRIFCTKIGYECWPVGFVLIWWRTWSSSSGEKEEQYSSNEIMKSKKKKKKKIKVLKNNLFQLKKIISLFVF